MSERTFAVFAYKECRFLEECILSLKNQTVKTDIIVATSTPLPNDFIIEFMMNQKQQPFLHRTCGDRKIMRCI